jgi:hypothetical protein
MNEQEKNTDTTATPTPESQVETTTTDVVETVAGESVDATPEVKEESTPEVAVTSVVEEKAEVTPVSEAASPATEEAVAKTSPIALVTGYLVCAKKWVLSRKYTISAIVLVLVALTGLLYIMEEQGKTNTGIFDKAASVFSAGKAVAKVNGEKITQKELDTSVSQIAAGAEAQGMDPKDPELVAQIQTQAVEMLINTELLMQEAKVRGVSVSDEDITARITALTEEVGGEEVLAERMAQFGIDNKTLRRDVRNELTIQKLLAEVFAEKEVAITDEEVKEFYDGAGGEEAGLPPLEEVAEQIKTQIQSTKEQEQVTTIIEELRGKANIEILI